MDRGEATVISPTQVAALPVKGARGARMAVLLGPEQGAPRFTTRRFFLAPGGRIPAHRHDTIEHEQVVIRGEVVLGLGERTREVRAGDAVLIPAGTAHWYENRGSEEAEFICVVPNTAEYSTEWLEAPPDDAFLG